MSERAIPIANIYYLFCYAWDHVEERDVVRVQDLEGLDKVHDLLGKVLAQGIFRLIRRSIDHGYRDVREELPGIRGKIAVGETAKRGLRARGQVACEYGGAVAERAAQSDPEVNTEVAVAAAGLACRRAERGTKRLHEARRGDPGALKPPHIPAGAT